MLQRPIKRNVVDALSEGLDTQATFHTLYVMLCRIVEGIQIESLPLAAEVVVM